MKFMVELRLKPGSRNQALAAFEQRGPNRNPGVTFQGAWVGAQEDVVFVLVEGENEARVVSAGQSWQEFGESQIHRVIDIEQY